MPGRGVYFFGTKPDLESVLKAVEAERTLQYVETGLFDSPLIRVAPSPLASSTIERTRDGTISVIYLVARSGVEIKARAVPQRRGGTKYAVDQLENPQTISFSPGGVLEERCLIGGNFGTASDHRDSLELLGLFKKKIAKHFEKIRGFFVGNEAAHLLDQGWRLTTHVKGPSTSDLKRFSPQN